MIKRDAPTRTEHLPQAEPVLGNGEGGAWVRAGQGQLSRSDIASQRDHFSAIGDKAKKLRGRRRESDKPGRC